MPRRFFRKFAFKRHDLSERWYLAPFRPLLRDDRLWGIRRKTVVPALALGIFIGFLPVPGHVIIGVLCAWLMHVNIPVTALATFVSNPLTIGPIYYFGYRVGATLLSIEPQPFSIELSFEWLSTTLGSIWQPLLLGTILSGAMAALIGYIVLDIFWRLSISDYKTRKRSQRRR